MISTERPISEYCRELGLNFMAVNQWVIKRRQELSGQPDPKVEDRELEMENAFLEKSAAFFAREQGRPRVTVSCWRRRPGPL